MAAAPPPDYDGWAMRAGSEGLEGRHGTRAVAHLQPLRPIGYGGESAQAVNPEGCARGRLSRPRKLHHAVEGPLAKIAMSTRRQPKSTNLHRLIAADPIERLLATMEIEIRLRTRRFTDPKLSTELQMLKSFKADLDEALNDARNADVIGNVAAAAELSKRPLSTVRRFCGKHLAAAGASWVDGEWSIHLPTFMNFQASQRRRSSDTGDKAEKRALEEPTESGNREGALEDAA